MALTLGEVRAFLDALLLVHLFEGDQNGPYAHYADTPAQRLGVALQPAPGLAAWAERQRLDALVMHRPWGLKGVSLPVLAYHYAFDERLTTGYNPPLAEALSMTRLEVLGYKEGRPLGMIGDVPRAPLSRFRGEVEGLFGGLEGAYGFAEGEVSRVCVVGAMRPPLIYEAAERGAQVYLTGQYRKGAARAVVETGLTVLEIGHARSERWGLGMLVRLLQAEFPTLKVVLYPVGQ